MSLSIALCLVVSAGLRSGFYPFRNSETIRGLDLEAEVPSNGVCLIMRIPLTMWDSQHTKRKNSCQSIKNFLSVYVVDFFNEITFNIL